MSDTPERVEMNLMNRPNEADSDVQLPVVPSLDSMTSFDSRRRECATALLLLPQLPADAIRLPVEKGSSFVGRDDRLNFDAFNLPTFMTL